MILTGGFDGFDVIDSRFWWFWQVVLMVLMFWQQVLMVLMFWQQVLMFLMILTGGFCFWRLYNKWQQVLMFLMILTAGFDDFDRWFWWFWCFDSRFWWFWQVVLMVLMVLTAGFDSRFWWFWQVVFVFEGCILNHVIMTEGFVFWRCCYQEIPLPPIAAYLWLCCEKLWRLFTAVNKSWLFIE